MNETKDKGWVKLDRSVLEEWFWEEGKAFDKAHAWVDILLNTNYKAKQCIFEDELITIKEGCIITSVLKLSNRWMWDRKKVSSFLKHLKMSNKIDYRKFKNGILIEVLSEKKNNSESLDVKGVESFFCTGEEQPVTQAFTQVLSHPDTQEFTQPKQQELLTTKDSNKEENDKNNNLREGNTVIKEEGSDTATDRQNKKKYLECIFLSDREYNALVSDLGEMNANMAIMLVDDYKRRTGKTYDNDFLAITTWGIKALKERNLYCNEAYSGEAKKENDESEQSEEVDEFERLMWERLA